MEILDKAPGSRLLPKGASTTDKIKYDLCSRFVVYRREKGISQKDLAARLGIDPAQMSKLLHYHIDEFSLGHLLDLLLVIYPKTEVKFEVA